MERLRLNTSVGDMHNIPSCHKNVDVADLNTTTTKTQSVKLSQAP